MAKLTTAQRNKIPGDEFALPGRRYPIEDRAHAANAEARASEFATPAEKAEIDAKVHAKYPGMGDTDDKAKGRMAIAHAMMGRK